MITFLEWLQESTLDSFTQVEHPAYGPEEMQGLKPYNKKYVSAQTSCSELPTIAGRQMCEKLHISTFKDLSSYSLHDLITMPEASRIQHSDLIEMQRALWRAGLTFKGSFPPREAMN